jgi:glucose/arabinose dehydrogenase
VKAQETLLAEREERYRAIIQAPDGSLIVLTDDPEGKVLRLSPN